MLANLGASQRPGDGQAKLVADMSGDLLVVAGQDAGRREGRRMSRFCDHNRCFAADAAAVR